MTDLFTHQDNARNVAIDSIGTQIAAGTINRESPNVAASILSGGSNPDGRWTQHDSFELLEQGLTRHALALPRIIDTTTIPPLSRDRECPPDADRA